MTGRFEWTGERVERMVAILLRGGTYADVAIAVGCRKNSVASKVSQMRERRDSRLPASLIAPDARYQRNITGIRGRIMCEPGRVLNPPPPIAPRDPCFRCGVRRDVGCIHTAHERLAA